MKAEVNRHQRRVAWRSGLVILAVYFLYGGLWLPFVLAGGPALPWMLALSTLLPLIFLSFLYWLSPILITWLTKVNWTGPKVLSEGNQEFLRSICSAENIANLRVGVLDTSVPNAFVYGRRRAPHLVLTRGLLELLPEDELNAVIAHEVGHLRNRDFIILAIAMVIPMILLQIGWRMLSSGGNSHAGAAIRVLGVFLLSLYWVSKLVYLVLSRARESYADAFSASATNDPDSLARALLRIAHGAAVAEAALRRAAKNSDKTSSKSARREAALLRPVAALAIDNLSPRFLPLNPTLSGSAQLGLLMTWDSANPWALLYQSESSHPSTTFRIAQLNKFTHEMGFVPSFSMPAPHSRPWKQFLFDLCAFVAPYVGVALSLLTSGLSIYPVLFLCGGSFRLWYRYHGKERAATTTDLIGRVDASNMKSIRVRVSGKLESGERFGITGFVLVDNQGAIPVRISPWSIVARIRLSSYCGETVVFSGWYRRSDIPWLEPLRIMASDGRVIIRVRTRIVKLIALLFYGAPVVGAAVSGLSKP